MSFIIAFFCCAIVVEGITSFVTVDHYGYHITQSIIISLVLIGFGYLISEVEVTTEDNSTQAQLLAEQVVGMDEQVQQTQEQFEDIFDDIILDIEQGVVEERPSEPVVTINQLRTDTQIVPSNTAYIDKNRRNETEPVLYNDVTRQGCIGDDCFKARLVQHTDGTFWACKRNYGMCYQYE